jgi:hypothetical protein
MLTATQAKVGRQKERNPAEIADRLHAKSDKALSRAHNLRSLACALVHLLNDAKGIDDEPLVTALDLAAMIETQAEALAHRIDKIGLGLSSLRREMNIETTVP